MAGINFNNGMNNFRYGARNNPKIKNATQNTEIETNNKAQKYLTFGPNKPLKPGDTVVGGSGTDTFVATVRHLGGRKF